MRFFTFHFAGAVSEGACKWLGSTAFCSRLKVFHPSLRRESDGNLLLRFVAPFDDWAFDQAGVCLHQCQRMLQLARTFLLCKSESSPSGSLAVEYLVQASSDAPGGKPL